MVTETKTKRLHWAPETPVTMELIDDYAVGFHDYDIDSFTIAARNASIAHCRAKLNALLSHSRPRKAPRTSVEYYTMGDVMTEAIYFYSGFCEGTTFALKRVMAELEAAGFKLPKDKTPS